MRDGTWPTFGNYFVVTRPGQRSDGAGLGSALDRGVLVAPGGGAVHGGDAVGWAGRDRPGAARALPAEITSMRVRDVVLLGRGFDVGPVPKDIPGCLEPGAQTMCG